MIQEHRQIPPTVWVLSALLLALFSFQAISEYLSSSIRMGIVLQQDGSRVNIIAINKDTPAERAGIPAGSILLAMDSHPIKTISDITPALKAARDKQTMVLTLEQDGVIRQLEIRPGIPANYRSLVLNLLILLLYISIGLAAIRASRIDARTRLLAWFSFAVALDITTYININYWPGSQVFYSSYKQMLAVLQFALVFHLLSLIPRPAPWMKWKFMPVAIYVLALGFHLLFVLVGFGILSLGETAQRFTRFLMSNNMSFISWGLTALLVLIYQFFRVRDKRERQQVKWILLSVIPWLLLQLSDLLVPDRAWVYSSWYAFADKIVHLLFPVGMFTAIFRHNLLDLNDLFPRNFFYSLLTILLLALPGLAIMEAGVHLSERYTPDAAIWLTGLAMFILGYAFSPTRDRLIQILEGRSWYKQQHLGRDLRQLAEDLSTMDGLEEIQRQLTSRLTSLLHAERVILHLDDGLSSTSIAHGHGSLAQNPLYWPGKNGEVICLDKLNPDQQDSPRHLGNPAETNALQKVLYRHGLELIIPLRLHGENFGTLLIGRNLGQQRYSWRETELLNLFAQSISAKFANALLHSQVQFDELTGIYRRKAILEILGKGISHCLSTGAPLTIAMIDLDDFKMVNDQHGHLAGDQVLKMVAATALRILGEKDRLGRYGGEEFLLVMPGRDIPSATVLCEKLRQAVEALHEQDHCATTASLGIAGLEEIGGSSTHSPQKLANELIALADHRLYQAKAAGKNQTVHN